MKKRFQKLAVATAVTAAMAGLSLPAQAIVTGIAGEALLVPLTIWDNTDDLNTLIEIEVPANIGWEGVANTWMAPNTTPIDPLTGPDDFKPSAFPEKVVVVDGDGGSRNLSAIHWFVFNRKSEHVYNDKIAVTPNDVVQVNYKEAVGGDLEGEPTYMVFTTEASYRKPSEGATFAMFGDAWLVNDNGFQVEIPVLPMSDGPDKTDYPVYDDHVVYKSGWPDVSPLASGNLLNYADGNFGGAIVFDVPLSTPGSLTYHVLWRDMNVPTVDDLLLQALYGEKYLNWEAGTSVDLMIFDSDEKGCSDSIDLAYELEIICYDHNKEYDGKHGLVAADRRGYYHGCHELDDRPMGFDSAFLASAEGMRSRERHLRLPSTVVKSTTCKTNEDKADGFVSYSFPELLDLNSEGPESSGLMFAIMSRTIGDEDENKIRNEMALGRYRGFYNNAY
jgi:hypothetical protein